MWLSDYRLSRIEWFHLQVSDLRLCGIATKDIRKRLVTSIFINLTSTSVRTTVTCTVNELVLIQSPMITLSYLQILHKYKYKTNTSDKLKSFAINLANIWLLFKINYTPVLLEGLSWYPLTCVNLHLYRRCLLLKFDFIVDQWKCWRKEMPWSDVNKNDTSSAITFSVSSVLFSKCDMSAAHLNESWHNVISLTNTHSDTASVFLCCLLTLHRNIRYHNVYVVFCPFKIVTFILVFMIKNTRGKKNMIICEVAQQTLDNIETILI